jgi:hypothetical protein
MSTSTLREIGARLGDLLSAPGEPRLFTWFQRFFLGKILLVECYDLAMVREVSFRELAPVLLVGAGFLLSELQRWSRLGFVLAFVVEAARLIGSFPYTINHAFFEAALLLVFALWDPSSPRAAHPLRVAQAGILVVFFQAGIQKLANGQYVDGQFLGLTTLFENGGMGSRMRAFLGLMARVGGLDPLPPLPLPQPSWIQGASVHLPGWTWNALRVMSNGVWIAELGLPALAIHRSSRRWAVLGLLVLEGSILTLSGEVSFGLTTIACLLTFFPQAARWTYPTSFLALCGVVWWIGV